MTMISLDQLQKHKEADQKNSTKDLEAGAVSKKTKKDEASVPLITWEERFEMIKLGLFIAICAFLLTVLAVHFLTSMTLPNTNPLRIVPILKRDSGNYSFELDGNRVSEIISNGPDGVVDGGFKLGDEIVFVNGAHFDLFVSKYLREIIMTMSKNVDVILVVQAEMPQEVPFQLRFERALFWATFVAAAIVVFTFGYALEEKRGYVCKVKIAKVDGKIGIERAGNRILSVTPGGPADGRLKEGDIIIAINGVRTALLREDNIKALIKTRDDYVKLAVERKF